MENEAKIKKLNELSGYIKFILNTAFENNNYFFTDTDKEVIISFREKLFEVGLENIENVLELQEIIKIIIKIHTFSLKGRKEETDFIDKLFPKEYIIFKIENHIEKTYLSKEKLNIEEIKNLDNLLVYLINENIDITPTINKSIKLLESNNINISDMTFMNTFIQRFTEGRFLIQSDIIQKNFDLAYYYVDLKTQKKDFNLFDNQEISDVLQILNKIPNEKSEKFLEIILKNLEIGKNNIGKINERIQKYVENNYDSTIVDEEQFEEFLKDLQKYKIIQNDVINIEIVKLILQQFFNRNSVIYQNKIKYFGLLQRMLEELSANDLKNNNIKGCCFFRSEYGQKISAGQNLPFLFTNVINIDGTKVLQDNGILNLIGFIYHENTHTIQYSDIQGLTNLDKNSLRMLQFKEEIIKKYNPEYYIANYELMFQEIEARERANVKLLALINSLKISGFEKLKEELKNKIIIEQSNYKLGMYKKKSIRSDDKIDINRYMDELIRMYPEILDKYEKFFKQCDRNK